MHFIVSKHEQRGSITTHRSWIEGSWIHSFFILHIKHKSKSSSPSNWRGLESQLLTSSLATFPTRLKKKPISSRGRGTGTDTLIFLDLGDRQRILWLRSQPEIPIPEGINTLKKTRSVFWRIKNQITRIIRLRLKRNAKETSHSQSNGGIKCQNCKMYFMMRKKHLNILWWKLFYCWL